jgi:hypothetical protein
MIAMRRIVVVVALLAAASFHGVPAAAADELGGTGWASTGSDCPIDEISFHNDGTLSAYDVNDDNDTGTWSVDGDTLTIRYDNWPGGETGKITGDTIATTVTWKTNGGEVQKATCTYALKTRNPLN